MLSGELDLLVGELREGLFSRARLEASAEQLARAHVALLAREAVVHLDGLSDRALDHLDEQLFAVPASDLSLLVTLPKLIGPDLKRLQEAVSRDDPDWGWDALTAVAKQVTLPSSEPGSPTRWFAWPTSVASTAAKRPWRSSTLTADPPDS